MDKDFPVQSFIVWMPSSIGSALHAAYGKNYTGKYNWDRVRSEWVHEEDGQVCILIKDVKGHGINYVLWDNDIAIHIDYADENIDPTDPTTANWGKLSFEKGLVHKFSQRTFPQYELDILSFQEDDIPAPPPSETSTETPTNTGTSTATPTESKSSTTLPGPAPSQTTTLEPPQPPPPPPPPPSQTITTSPSETITTSPSETITTSPSETITTSPSGTPSCSPYEEYKGPKHLSPENCPDCWVVCEDCDCPCPTSSTTPSPTSSFVAPTSTETSPRTSTETILLPQTETETKTASTTQTKTRTLTATLTASISQTATPTETESPSATPSESYTPTCQPITFATPTCPPGPETEKCEREGKESALDDSHVIDYAFLINGEKANSVEFFKPCQFYTLFFPGSGNSFDNFDIIQDDQQIWPTLKPYLFDEPVSDITGESSKKWKRVLFGSEPGSEHKPGCVKWRYKVPSCGSGGVSQSRMLSLASTNQNQTSTETFSPSPTETPTLCNYEDGDTVCLNGVVYKKVNSSSCSCDSVAPTGTVSTSPSNTSTITASNSATDSLTGTLTSSSSKTLTKTPSNSQTLTESRSPTESPTLTESPTTTESRSSTESPTPTESPTETPTCEDNCYVYGWFCILDCGCKQSAENTIETETEGAPYSCGGYCLYEWQVNVIAEPQEDGGFCMKPESEVTGPIKSCAKHNVETNYWTTPESLKNCVSISEADKLTMTYYSLDTENYSQCTCDEYTDACPEPDFKPKPPLKSWIVPPCAENKAFEQKSSYPIKSDQESRTFYIVYEGENQTHSGYITGEMVTLEVDAETGMPIELSFPESLFNNGVIDRTSQAYRDHVDKNSGEWEEMTVRFYDSAGEPWTLNGVFRIIVEQ